jgi:hypothetical protein
MSPNAGGGGFGVSVREYSRCKWSPNKLWRSNSIFYSNEPSLAPQFEWSVNTCKFLILNTRFVQCTLYILYTVQVYLEEGENDIHISGAHNNTFDEI